MHRDGRTAFEWSLAPICLGAPLAVTAVLAIPAGEWAAAVWQVVPNGGWFGALVMSVPTGFSLLSLAGAAAGLRAVMLCRASSRPVAFALAGIALCLSATALWAVATAVWYEQLQGIGAIDGMLRQYGSSGGTAF